MLNSSSVPLHFFLLVKDANHMNVLSYLVSTYFGSTQMPKIDDVPSKLYFYEKKIQQNLMVPLYLELV